MGLCLLTVAEHSRRMSDDVSREQKRWFESFKMEQIKCAPSVEVFVYNVSCSLSGLSNVNSVNVDEIIVFTSGALTLHDSASFSTVNGIWKETSEKQPPAALRMQIYFEIQCNPNFIAIILSLYLKRIHILCFVTLLKSLNLLDSVITGVSPHSHILNHHLNFIQCCRDYVKLGCGLTGASPVSSRESPYSSCDQSQSQMCTEVFAVWGVVPAALGSQSRTHPILAIFEIMSRHCYRFYTNPRKVWWLQGNEGLSGGVQLYRESCLTLPCDYSHVIR